MYSKEEKKKKRKKILVDPIIEIKTLKILFARSFRSLRIFSSTRAWSTVHGEPIIDINAFIRDK